MLSAEDFQAARDTQRLTMLDEATIQRPTEVSDGMGGIEHTWEAIGTVICRIAVNAGRDAFVIAGQLRETAPWKVTFPALTDVRVTDRLIVKGMTLEVVGVAGPSTFETARIVICEDA